MTQKMINGELFDLTEEEEAELTARRQAMALPLALAAASAALAEQLSAAFGRGCPYDFGDAPAVFADGTTGPAGVQVLQTRDDTDRTNWLILESVVNDMLSAGLGSSDLPTPVRTLANAEIAVTASTAKSMLQAMKANGAAKLSYSWALKNQILAAPTVEAVQSIALTSGWPT